MIFVEDVLQNTNTGEMQENGVVWASESTEESAGRIWWREIRPCRGSLKEELIVELWKTWERMVDPKKASNCPL